MDQDLVSTPEDAERARTAARLRTARAGDRDAFSVLVGPEVPALHALARRLTGDPHWADDLTQEALLRAFLALPKFRAECSLSTWLFRILVRLASEPRRWKKTERASSLADLEVPARLDTDAIVHAEGRELEDRVAEAMERLPLRQRAALHLRAAEGFDYPAIAGVLLCSPGAARMLVLEARKKLGARLRRHLEP